MKVSWIIFIGTYFAFDIFLSEATSATYPFSIIHSAGVPGFSKDFSSLTGWILTTLTVTHLMTRSTFAASIAHLNTTQRAPKGIFGSKFRDDDDDDEDSGKTSSIKDKARLFLGTLNRNNCFAKVLCGLGSQTPSEKTDLLNDYVFLMNDLLYDDEGNQKTGTKKRKRPGKPYTRDDIKFGGGGYDEDEEGGRPFEHEVDEDGELENFDKEFDYATLGDLADEEMVNEEGPSVLSYIMQEAKNKIPRLKLRVGRSIKENITDEHHTTSAPKISSGEMGSVEASSYILMKKQELNKTQDVEKTLKIANEAGNKLRSARQCRLLFDQCPFAANQITEILGNLRKILQGQPVSQPTSAFFPAFSAPPGVLPRPIQTAQTVTGGGGGGNGNNNNVDKVEIVVHLNGAKNNGNGGYSAQANSNIGPPPQQMALPVPQTPYLPPVPPQPVQAGSLNFMPPQPVQAGSLNPVSETQPQIPIPSETGGEPATNGSSQSPTMAYPQSQMVPQTNPQAVQQPIQQPVQQPVQQPAVQPLQPYPQTVQQQMVQQQIAQLSALQQQYPQAAVPQYQYTQQMTPEMIMQMYPQMAGTQPVTQDKIIDFLQGILEHNGNGEAQSPLVPKESKKKVNTILIDGKEVPTKQYLQNLKKTLQTLAQMNKLALATEAQIVAKDAANGEPSEEDEDSPEDDEGAAGVFPDLFSDGPDITSLTQNESSEEEEDKVVKLKPQKGVHHNQRPTGLRPTPAEKKKKPWGLGQLQNDDPFEEEKEKRKDGQFIDQFIKAGVSQPKPKEEVQPTRKKKKKNKPKGQYNRRKKKPDPVSKENDSFEPEVSIKQNDKQPDKQQELTYYAADQDDKQQDDISGEDSEEEEPQDEESAEDDEGDLEKPPKNNKIKFSLKAYSPNASTTPDPYLPSPEEKEKLNILTDILLPGAYDRPKGSKGSRPKGSSNPKRPAQPIRIPISSSFNQDFEKISSDIGNGTEILHIDEFSENSDKVPLFKRSKRKKPKGPKAESDEEEEEDEEENEETDPEDYVEDGKGRRMRKPPRQRVALVALPYQNDDPEDDGKLPTESPASSLQTNIMSYLVGLTGVKPVNPLPTEDSGTHPFEHYLTYKAPYQPDEKPSKHPFAFYKPGYTTPAPDVFSKNPKFREEEDESSEEEKAKYDKKDKKKDDDKKDKKKKKKKKDKDKDKDDSEEDGHSTQYHYNNIPPKTEHGHEEINHDDPSKTKGVYLSMTMHDDGFPLIPDAYELALPIPHINDGFISVPAPEEHGHDYGHLHHPHEAEDYHHHAAAHGHHHHAMPHHHHHPHHHGSDEDDDSEEKKKKKKDKDKDKKKKKKKKKDKDGDEDGDEDGDHGWGSEEDDDGKDKDKKKKKKKKGKDNAEDEESEEDDIADVPPESEPIGQALSKVIPGFGKSPQTQAQFSEENHSQLSQPSQINPYLNGPLLLKLPAEPEDDEDDDNNSGETSIETAPKRKSPSNQSSGKTNSPAPTNSTSNRPTTKPKRVMKYKAVVRRASTTTFRPRLRNTTLKPNQDSEESSDSNSPSKSSPRRPERKKNNFRSGMPTHDQHYDDNQRPMSSEIHFDSEDDGRSGLNKGGSSFEPSSQFGSVSGEGHEHMGAPNDGMPSLRLPDNGDPYEVNGPDGNRYPVYHDSHPLTVLPLPDLTTLFSGLKNINFGGHFHG